ncbi:MAG TPA: hypothetical protein PLM08_25650, partial [Polyangiaceae bacterium]|nr:hypothetical protein [Polyangiaceae bacterium]
MKLAFAFAVMLLAATSLGCKKRSKKGVEDTTSDSVAVASAGAGVSSNCRKLCLLVGKCTEKDGKCYAGSKAECEASVGCKSAGLCSLKEERCVA